MPLKDFIAETMQIWSAKPTPPEICVERVHPLRFAAEEGRFDATFQGMNEAMSGRAVKA
jgi:uncharacterized oxidoreductase